MEVVCPVEVTVVKVMDVVEVYSCRVAEGVDE